MLKKITLFLPLLLLVGCTTGKFTRLTPNQQYRNPSGVYTVEVEFNSTRQVLRWDSIKPFIVADGHIYPMRQVPMVKGRWEGEIPVPAGVNSVNYRFKFDYLSNSIGSNPVPSSEASKTYTLQIVDQ
jgi:hypothetical protein